MPRTTTRRTRTLRLASAGLAAAAAVTLTAFSGGAAQASTAKDATTLAGTPACSVKDVSLKVESIREPINTYRLSLKNHSKKTCVAYKYPQLRFGSAKSPAKVVASTKPRTAVKVKPGHSAYAAIHTSGDGNHGYRTKKLKVTLSGAPASASSTGVALPGGPVYLDDTVANSYWVNNPRIVYTW
ncbi:DUF4232 domain-containing protein [Streptomyces benahoarensis]|uniref:DUF4232 domain-containing protein n=1 Tax=Streptomyces benahoarensis TaxID=2595054 RepID=A0A553Z595_9ACTN|nr:DUF4232 domain-containing protein [Streptomyces benahoarensis]TSB20131.1 DUF4232 domain-containing protein [Streptomyces benahoarensis]TSB36645.1 DUF4232 domain-containing protein [Streptomyces benahoarensis]